MTRNRLKQAKIKLVFSSLILMLSIFGSVILSIGASSSKAFASTIPPGWSAPTQIDPVDGRPTSISCVSSSFCIGVDDAGNALNWNGTSWSISAAIDPEAYLSSVSCVSSSFIYLFLILNIKSRSESSSYRYWERSNRHNASLRINTLQLVCKDWSALTLLLSCSKSKLRTFRNYCFLTNIIHTISNNLRKNILIYIGCTLHPTICRWQQAGS